MNNTSLKTNNPFIIIKNRIRRKIALFIYPEINRIQGENSLFYYKIFREIFLGNDKKSTS